nr:hypothetical protein BACY1_00530 [Tenacibaculum mesophilum]
MPFKNIIEIFNDHVKNQSDYPAIKENNKSVSYQELSRKSNVLSETLLKNQSVDDALCFVLVNTITHAVTSLLGIFGAGKIFVPINKDLPNPTIMELIEEYTPNWFVYDDANEERMEVLTSSTTKSCEKINIEKITSNEVKINDNELGAKVTYSQDKACYVYFTSGTTGKPKGIYGAYRGINHFIHWEKSQLVDLPEKPNVSAFSPYSFDVFLRDVFMPLSTGGTLCVPPKNSGIIDINQLINWLKDQKVNLAHCVPTVLKGILNIENNENSIPSLKYLLMAGEKLYFEDIKTWRSNFGSNTQFVNIYGPSETSLAKFAYFVPNECPTNGVVPLGKPITETTALILNDALEEVSEGTTGELCIQTAYRSLGYFRNPTLTSKSFINYKNDTIYKTGDIVRKTSTGIFEFVGRKDFQIKLNGVRIELEEIESVIRSFKEVLQAVVIYNENSKTLVAFVEIKEQVKLEKIEADLKELLPGIKIPSYILETKDFPVNSNGKIDKKKLNEQFKEYLIEQQIQHSKLNEFENKLAGLWAEVLGVNINEIHLMSNFLALGGNSLKLISLVNKINKVFELNLSVKDVFEVVTLKDQASLLSLIVGDEIEIENNFEIEI